MIVARYRTLAPLSVFLSSAAILAACLAATPTLRGDNWPQWRGPDADGVAAGEGYPTRWSTTENVQWKYALPGIGASTPAIWENHIFVTGEHDGKNSVLCLNREGEKLWETTLDEHVAARNRKASGSNPSPVTDGQLVFVYFKSGELATLNFEGKVLWKTNLQKDYGEDTLWWDLGTSPVLSGDLVIVACMQSDNSYLVAFEKSTGKVAWKSERNLDAPGESAQSYTTPVVIQQDGRDVIITLGADHVSAHDAQTGKQLWVSDTLNPRRIGNYRSISSPVVSEGLVIAPYSRGGTLTALRLQPESDEKSRVAWTVDGAAADVPCPVVRDGKVYTCTDRGTVFELDLKTGRELAKVEVPRSRASFSASPVLAGRYLYVTNESGSTFVLDTQDQLKLVAQNELEDFIIATPVFCDGKAYIRTDAFLYCIDDDTPTESK